MKKFEIITEADARVLARGETVMLARAGHITPLAADTLKERRVTVVQKGGRRPRKRRWRRRPTIRRWPSAATTAASSCGRASSCFCADGPGRERSRAPMAPIRWTIRTSRRRSRDAVARGEADAGIVIDGAGIGSAIAANKIAASAR